MKKKVWGEKKNGSRPNMISELAASRNPVRATIPDLTGACRKIRQPAPARKGRAISINIRTLIMLFNINPWVLTKQ